MARHLMTLLLTFGVIFAAGWAYFCSEPILTKFKMDTIVQTAVLTWANGNLDKGKATLKHRLDEEVPEYLTEDMCTFYEDGDEKVVECNWYSDVEIPLFGNRRFTYNVTERASRDGRLSE